MSAGSSVDLNALPLKGSVLELRREDGRTRVTFKQLSSIYWLEDAHPQHAPILAALEESARTGKVLELGYALPGKNITTLR